MRNILLLLLLLSSRQNWAQIWQGEVLVQAARAQIGVTTGYDGSYQRLAYPMGDAASARLLPKM